MTYTLLGNSKHSRATVYVVDFKVLIAFQKFRQESTIAIAHNGNRGTLQLYQNIKQRPQVAQSGFLQA
jgi:UDP-N-acetylglucosamine transferase subunit ALG13